MKVYLAGYETMRNGFKVDLPTNYHLFLTYFYAPQTIKALQHLHTIGHSGLITIDSGAHSFFGVLGMSVTSNSHTSKKSKKDLPDPDTYFSKYLEWAKHYSPMFDYFCELDLQQIIGLEKIKGFRKRISSAGIGKQVICVHHRGDTWKDFEELCETSESKYIALEGVKAGYDMLNYNKYLQHAYKRGVRVHGFAFTRFQLLKDFPFYSVDSSSWTMGSRYGALKFWDGQNLRTAMSNQNHFSKYNIPISLVSSNRSNHDAKLKAEFSALQYWKAQEFYTRYWEARGVQWKDN